MDIRAGIHIEFKTSRKRLFPGNFFTYLDLSIDSGIMKKRATLKPLDETLSLIFVICFP
jgi:hypothetical protein